MRRIIVALTTGLITYLSLRVFPYFPHWWAGAFSLATALLSYWFYRAAFMLVCSVFGISLLYHAPELFIVYLIAVVLLISFSGHISSFSRIFILVVFAPYLTTFSVLDRALPVEFMIIFLSAIIFRRSSTAAIVAGISCIWCCVIGIIGQQEFLGNLVIGIPMYKFYSISNAPIAFYNFGWLKDAVFSFDIFAVGTVLLKLIKFLLYQPLIFLQAIAWAIISSSLHLCISKKRWWGDIAAYCVAVILITALQYIVLFLYPEKIDFDFHSFTLTVAGALALVYAGWQIIKFLSRASLWPAEPEASEDYLNAANIHDDAISPVQKAPVEGEGFTVENLSLDESLKMQRHLQQHISKKFVRAITAVDIDVAEGTNIKIGESQENVLYSFNRYWKTVDACMEKRQGKIVSRAGDGAMYIFNNADQAISAAVDTLKDIVRFNEKESTLQKPFQVRIGINSGSIVSDPNKSNSEIFSAVFDVAGHLQKMAATGQILISENTYKIIRNKQYFEAGPLCEKDSVNTFVYTHKKPRPII